MLFRLVQLELVPKALVYLSPSLGFDFIFFSLMIIEQSHIFSKAIMTNIKNYTFFTFKSPNQTIHSSLPFLSPHFNEPHPPPH